MRRFFIWVLLFQTLTAAEATFAGGCFWCVEHAFDHLAGVEKTTVGYTGGVIEHPTYKQVSSGQTGHVEAVKVTYDPEKISYEKLLDIYFRNIDPTRDDGQFCDKGEQYRPVIFYHTQRQKALAEGYKDRLIASKKFKRVTVEILPEEPFYPAENYHQKYYKKNPIRYQYYRKSCGRDRRLKELWKN